MLTHLQIRDFAIVEAVELELRRGFTALTGETGAGKSILVDAVLLAVGGRADSGAVRHGAERAEVTASFAIANNAPAARWATAGKSSPSSRGRSLCFTSSSARPTGFRCWGFSPRLWW